MITKRSRSLGICLVATAIGIQHPVDVYGQIAPQVEWEKRYGGPGYQGGRSVLETKEGGFVVAGGTTTLVGGDPTKRAYVVRTDPVGEVIWEKTYGDEAAWAASIIETKAGDFVFVGTIGSGGEATGRIYLVKIDESEGDVAWEKTPGSVEPAFGVAARETSDGGFIIAGTTVMPVAFEGEILLVMTNEVGEPVWEKTIEGFGVTSVRDLLVATDGGYIISGSLPEQPSSDLSVPFLLKTDEAGEILWGWRGDLGSGGVISPSQDGGTILAATTFLTDRPISFTTAVKFDRDGLEEWRTTLSVPDMKVHSVQETNDGKFVVLGASCSWPDNIDLYLVKGERTGCFWTKRFFGIPGGAGGAVMMDREGGFVVVGATDEDVYLAKLEPDSSTAEFVRGNANGDGLVDISDPVFVLNFLFQGGAKPGSVDTADTNDDGAVDITDAVYLLAFLFLGGMEPPEPFAAPGLDRTHDDLGCSP